MEYCREEEEEVVLLGEPVSPNGRYFNNSIASVAILAVLEIEIPIDDSQTFSLLTDVFLPINPRFSSIMVENEGGKKHWKRVEVKLEDHVHVPVLPNGRSLESYSNYFDEYVTKIASARLPQSCRPMWEVHIFKYPTNHAAGHIIFKIHHALGDGYSLMGALLSCLQNAHNPSLPLTFPSLKGSSSATAICNRGGRCNVFAFVPRVLSFVLYSVLDFSSTILKGISVLKDDRTPIRSGDDGIENRPITLSNVMLSLEKIKLVKNKLGVTINDVIVGTIFLGVRMYIQDIKSVKSSTENCTALVLMSTRIVGSYKAVKEMIDTDSTGWGNKFTFLQISLPKSTQLSQPLDFVMEARDIIKRQRNSAVVYLTSRYLDILEKLRGLETVARYINNSIKNSSMSVSNMIGPLEQVSLANHPVRGIYHMVVGTPVCLNITVMSYMGNLRIVFGAEKDFIDSNKLNVCIKTAFEMIAEAANQISR